METACFVWNETEAKSGSCEVATAVFKYLVKLDQEGKQTVHLFYDRCAGQNNNRTIVVMLSYATTVLKNIKEITLNVLVTGHSHHENHSVHSVIETATINKQIFTTHQWQMAITMSFKNHVPCVEVYDHSCVYDFKPASSLLQYMTIWKNSLKSDEGKNAGEKLYWSKLMILKFQKNKPGLLLFKYSYSDKEFEKCTIYQMKTTRRKSIYPNRMHAKTV